MAYFFFFQAEDGIRDPLVTGVQTCALPICPGRSRRARGGGRATGGRERAFLLAPTPTSTAIATRSVSSPSPWKGEGGGEGRRHCSAFPHVNRFLAAPCRALAPEPHPQRLTRVALGDRAIQDVPAREVRDAASAGERIEARLRLVAVPRQTAGGDLGLRR